MSGAVSITGHPDRPPSHFGFSLGDLATGLMGAFAVSGALYRRELAGEAFVGECVDLALYETLFRFIEWQVVLYDQLGFVPQRDGNRFPVGPSPVSDTYLSKDKVWITIASGTVNSVLGIVRMTDASLVNDERFGTQEAQMKNGRVLGEIVRQWVAANVAADVLRDCEKAGVAAAPVLSPPDMFESETFRERESIIRVADPRLDQIAMQGVVPRLANYPGRVNSTGPRLGEHTREVLTGWFSVQPHDYEALLRSGVVGEIDCRHEHV